MSKNNHILALALLGLTFSASAQEKSQNVLDIKESITDNSIVYPESFESNTLNLLEGWYLTNYTTTDDRTEHLGDPDVSDAEMRKRLAELPTLIDMPFNQIVRSYIDRYTKRSRRQVSAILGLGTYYIPIFEQELEAQGLPLELKYLPVIESGLDPNAVSVHGAAGLWQLMLATGKGLGLEVNSLVDERRDPYSSSKKAVGYLKDLYESYGDWSLAIAAYNCGPSAVNKALRRAGGNPKSHDFWSIYNYLPEETRGYVPMFIAANYVMNYYPQHNISPVLATKPLITDTVGIGCRLHFNQISEVLNIPLEELRILNPQFRADIIPATPERPYHLILPSQQVHAFIVSQKEIVAHDAEKYSRREIAEPGDMALRPDEEEAVPSEAAQESSAPFVSNVSADTPKANKPAATKTVYHKVSAGETLASIAQNYGVEQSDIKSWNNLRRNAVRTGQQLRIQVADDALISEVPAVEADNSPAPAADTNKKKTTASTSKKTTQKKQAPPKPTTYNVKNGDSLERIAKNNGTTVDALRKENPNLKGDLIRPGQKLNIPAKTNNSKSKGQSTKKSTSNRKKGKRK